MTEPTNNESEDELTLTKKVEIEHLGSISDGRTSDGSFVVRGRTIDFQDIEPFSLMPSGEEGKITRCAIKLKSGETVLISEDVFPLFTEWFTEHNPETKRVWQNDDTSIVICEAIKKRRLLQFSYDDLTRIVEPHLFGRKTSGNDVLSAYMVEGYTESDHEPYWRNYSVDKMDFIIMLDEAFANQREGYNPDNQTMEEIYCRL